VFRIAARSTSGQPAPTGPIVLPELAPVQLASYVAIQLPYGWQLWGLDVDDSLGDQQRAYFESLRDLSPERLIVATASPAYVFGARLMNDGHCRAAEALGLPVPKPDGATVDGHVRYRLDLSGDVHHYARYFPDGDGQRYGSVVSGLGGAFHHPSFTRATGADQRREPVIEYPSCDESLRSLGEGLLTARSTWFGSWARVVPFVLTLLLAFVGTHAAGGAWLLDQLFSLVPGHQPLSRGGVMDLLRSLCWLGVLVVAVGGVVVALVFARRVARAHVDTPAIAETFTQVLFGDRGGRLRRLVGVRRSYWFPWVIAIATTAPLFLYPLWGVTARTRGLDVAAVVILVALPLAGGVVAFRHGARHLALGTRLWVALIGVVHGAMQVVGAAILARVAMASWAAAGATVGVLLVLIVFTPLVRPLFRCERHRSMVGLAVVAVVAFAVSMGLVLWAGGCRVVAWPDGARMGELGAFGRHFLAALVAMPFGTMWFMWYLAVAGRAGAHNNELGAAAGVTSYRQLIRFHVHAEGLTGYVIAARTEGATPAARTGGKALAFELIDVFTIAAPAPTQAAGPPP
jgi:hypothetical protein